MLALLSLPSSLISLLSGEDEWSATSVLAMDNDKGDLLKTLEPGFRNNEYWWLVRCGLWEGMVDVSDSVSFHFIGIAKFSSASEV